MLKAYFTLLHMVKKNGMFIHASGNSCTTWECVSDIYIEFGSKS